MSETSPTLSLLQGSIAEGVAEAEAAAEATAEAVLGGPTKPAKPKATKSKTAGKAKSKDKSQAADGGELVVAGASSPPVEAAQSGEVLGPDLITDTVKEIENLSEEQARPLALELIGKSDYNSFKLGGVLARIMENKWFSPYQDFKSYVETEFGFSVRKAFYLIELYKGLCDLGLPWEDLKSVGWNKLKELAKIITKENAAEWLAKAAEPGMTVLKLTAAVADAKKAAEGGDDTSAEPSQPVVKKTFSLHPDQQTTLQKALDKAKKASGTDVDTVALDYMALDYLANTEKAKVDQQALSAGLDNKDAAAPSAAAPTKEAVKAYLKKIGLEATFGIFAEIWPEVNVDVNIPEGMDTGPSND